jgi:hypothetical protein
VDFRRVRLVERVIREWVSQRVEEAHRNASRFGLKQAKFPGVRCCLCQTRFHSSYSGACMVLADVKPSTYIETPITSGSFGGHHGDEDRLIGLVKCIQSLLPA